MTMSKYLRKMAQTPFEVIPCVSIDGAGDKSFGSNITLKCYPEIKHSVVLDKDGKEVTSNIKLYVYESYDIKTDDEIFFDNRQYVIKSLEAFYNKGVIGLLVVFI